MRLLPRRRQPAPPTPAAAAADTRCAATTVKGRPCKLPPVPGTPLCVFHLTAAAGPRPA
jgi:hypothetical protein